MRWFLFSRLISVSLPAFPLFSSFPFFPFFFFFDCLGSPVTYDMINMVLIFLISVMLRKAKVSNRVIASSSYEVLESRRMIRF